MTEIIRVSKANIDVLGTAGTVPNNLNYSSDYNTLKYYTAGSITLTGSSVFPFTTSTYGTVTHTLGYYPYYSVYVNDPSDTSRYYHNAYFLIGGGGASRYATVFAGTSALVFCLTLYASSGTLYGTATYYYKIFRNNVNI